MALAMSRRRSPTLTLPSRGRKKSADPLPLEGRVGVGGRTRCVWAFIPVTDTLPADPAGSAYFLDAETGVERRATFAVIVDNEPGVLARVVGLFSARGYNIESLTVAETDHAVHTSRITIVTRGHEGMLAQIQAQLGKIVQVRAGVSRPAATRDGSSASWRSSRCEGPATRGWRAFVSQRSSARGLSIRASDSFVFELTGAPDKIDKFEILMRPLGLVEVSRTGVLSIARGAERV